jgi:hypothetical protein
MHNNLFPKQRLSYKEKIKNNRQWGKDVIENLTLNFQSDYINDPVIGDDQNRSAYNKKLKNYRAFNNIIDQEDFERECNALGLNIGQNIDEVKPYNKMPNKIQALLGEALQRPFRYMPYLVNSEGIHSKQIAITKAFQDHVTTNISQLIELIRQRNMTQDPEQQQLINEEIEQVTNLLVSPQELEKLDETTFRDSREITTSKLLEYFRHKLDLTDLMVDAFKHGLISAEEIVWVGARNGEPTVEVVNPLGFFYDKSPEVKYIQDSMYAGYRTMMAAGDIIDRYGEYLSDKDVQRLEGTVQGINGIRDDLVGKTMKYHNVDIYHEYMSRMMNNSYTEGSYGTADQAGNHWQVTHIEWRSEKKVYFLKFINEYGDLQTDILSEDFEIPSDAEKITKEDRYGMKKTIYQWGDYTIEETWVPEVWEGTRIGSDIYCMIGPKEYQLRSASNPRDVKLGYHGIIYNNTNAESVSLMDRMMPFQFLFFIVAHKLKQLIAKDKGVVFHLDASMIPEELGLEKTLYYLEHLDLDIYNPLKNAEQPGSAQRGKQTGVSDRSTMRNISNYISLLDALDRQISDVAGISKGREGQTATQQSVTNAQQDLAQSSVVTEAIYFRPHFQLWKHVLTSLIRCAQSTWKGQHILRQYILDDMSIGTLEVSPDELSDCDLGIFITDSAKEHEVFQTLKQLAQPLLQNDKAKMSDIIKLIKGNSVQELEKQIIQSEKEFDRQQQEQLQAQQEQLQAQLEANKALEEDRQAHEIEIERIRMEKEILLKQMELNSQEDGPSEIDVKKILTELELKKQDLELKEKQHKDKMEIEKKKLAKASTPKT